MLDRRRSRGFLSASEAAAVFRLALDEELGPAVAGQLCQPEVDDRTPRVPSAAYRIAAGLDPDADAVGDDLLAAHTNGFPDANRRAVVLMLAALAPHRGARREAEAALAQVGAPVTAWTLRDARELPLAHGRQPHDRRVFRRRSGGPHVETRSQAALRARLCGRARRLADALSPKRGASYSGSRGPRALAGSS